MAILTDRDLLLIEPTLFVHAAAAGVVLVNVGDASLSETRLTAEGADFEALNIGPQHVGVLADRALEVVELRSSTQLDVSLPRLSPEDEPIPPAPGEGLSFSIVSFALLTERTHRAMLATAGIGDGETEATAMPAVLNTQALAAVVALNVIASAFATAAALNPAEQSLAARAALYRRRAAAAAGHTPLQIDLDGDGEADAVRRLDVVVLQRV